MQGELVLPRVILFHAIKDEWWNHVVIVADYVQLSSKFGALCFTRIRIFVHSFSKRCTTLVTSLWRAVIRDAFDSLGLKIPAQFGAVLTLSS